MFGHRLPVGKLLRDADCLKVFHIDWIFHIPGSLRPGGMRMGKQVGYVNRPHRVKMLMRREAENPAA